jgi:MFS family permease
MELNVSIAQPANLWTRLAAWIRNSPPVRYPDLGLICIGSFVLLVGVGAVVPVRTIYARDHGANMAEIGFMASAFILGQFLFQLPGGWASDRWGRKPLLVSGIAITGLISFLFLLNDHPWYFIALRFIEGAATGATNPAANAYVIDSVPPRERGAAFGWLGSAFSAGFMVGPAIGGFMVDLLGYASPFLFGGTLTLLTALFLALRMADRRPGTTPAPAPAPDADELPGNYVQDSGSGPADRESEGEREHEHARERRIPGALFVPALIGALVFITSGGFADGLFISIWSIWLNDLHASNSFIGFTFITFSLPLMVLMPFTGRLADRHSLIPMLVVPATLISFVYLVYGFTTNLALIAALGLLEGALVAVYGPALNTYIAELSPENARGRLQGFVSTVRTMSSFGSSMLVAMLYGINIAYPFYMLAGVQLLISLTGGLVVWWVERRTRQMRRALQPTPAGT